MKHTVLIYETLSLAKEVEIEADSREAASEEAERLAAYGLHGQDCEIDRLDYGHAYLEEESHA